ncbi:hypothetical protein [Erythrobacter sp.]|jgi:hypothetical protein|uniref:hypothetical protein n=1 Tax=Erythrobacter sp. TaxID=1042 RepID=UPI002EA6DC49|nr:hypothetical protein [Erythrobacter sp.]
MTTDLVLSIVMLAAILLLLGAYALWKRTGEAKQPALMVVLALVAIANVLIWTVPTSDGTAPVDRIEDAGPR